MDELLRAHKSADRTISTIIGMGKWGILNQRIFTVKKMIMLGDMQQSVNELRKLIPYNVPQKFLDMRILRFPPNEQAMFSVSPDKQS